MVQVDEPQQSKEPAWLARRQLSKQNYKPTPIPGTALHQ